MTRIVELDGIHDEPQCYDGGYTAYRDEKAAALAAVPARLSRRRRRSGSGGRPTSSATKEHARGVETTVRRGPGADQLRRYAKKVAKKAKVRERRLRRQLDAARWLAEPQTRPAADAGVPPRPATAGPRAAQGRSRVDGRRPDAAGRRRLRRSGGGDRILLSGRNGAGKTTLLRVLAGLGSRTPAR